VFETNFIFPPLIAFLVTVVFTPLVRLLATKKELLANPVGDRWHDVPTPLFGGVAISIGLLVATVFTPLPPILLSGILLIFLVGLFDDVLHLSPKLRICSLFSIVCWGRIHRIVEC
jgi:UDP-GlcNAc:undecaprenyl-phosphate/decaprenyl-phosphate GlcNAc-1-phosphate transferase